MTGKVFYAGGAIPNNNNGTGGLVPITYADLVALKNVSKLVEGTYYKITDYVTTTNGNSPNTDEPSRSAGHQFDIVVRATSTSTLSELASASLHEGDTYFATQNVGAWQIWYDINNDTTKYHWAVTDGTGKGVIYRMIDEHQNDLPYDFKNIQFYRDKTLEKYSHIADQMKIEDGYYYTFTTTQGTDTSKYGDMSLLTGDYVLNNIIPRFNKNTMQVLNNIVSVQGNSRNFSSNTFGTDCFNNTFGSQIRGNSFGYAFYNNVVGDSISYNIFYGYAQGNIIYDNLFDNKFGLNCRKNNIKVLASNEDYFQGNTIGEWFQNNNVLSYFFGNSISNSASNNTFKDIFQGNVVDIWFQNNTCNGFTEGCTFKQNVQGNIFGDMTCNTFGGNFRNNTIGNYTYYCNFGKNNSYLILPTGTLSSDGKKIETWGSRFVTTKDGTHGTSSNAIDLSGAISTLNTLFNKTVELTSDKNVVILQETSEGYKTGLRRKSSETSWTSFTSKPQITKVTYNASTKNLTLS